MNTSLKINLMGSDVETCKLTFTIEEAPGNGTLSGTTDKD